MLINIENGTPFRFPKLSHKLTRLPEDRLDRLLSLSRKSDEDNYRLNLARQGTPSERELDGKTLCRAIGTWLTDYSRAEEIQSLRKSKQDQKVSPGMTSSGAKAVASFRSEDGRQLTEDLWDFAA